MRNGLRAELKRRGRLLLGAPAAIFATPVTTGVALFGVVAMLAVTCTASYGLLNQGSTSQSLAKQINRAALITVQSQQAGPSVIESTGQANPWWIKPADGPYRVFAHVHRLQIPHDLGLKVMAIGDSVMLASAPELAQAMPGIYINAQVSRAMIAGVVLVQDLAAQKRLRRVIVVALGTNGPIALAQIQQLTRAIGPHRWLLLVNTFVPRSWEGEVNATIVAAARKYPNVRVINWHKAIQHHTNLLWSDGIHPMPIGGKLYAKAVRFAVIEAIGHRPPTRHAAQTQHDGAGVLLRANYARQS